MYKLLIFSALIALSAAAPRAKRSAFPIAAAPAFASVPALAAVPTLTAVHQQRLIPQAPGVHTVARPTTVLQTVQTGNAITGHQQVGEQVVGRTPDVNGYAFRSDVRHDAPVALAAPAVAVAAPAPVAAAPVAVAAAPAPVVAAPVAAAPAALPIVSAVPAPAPVQTVHPAPPAQVKSYSTEIGHHIAHDTVVTSPVIKNTVHSPVFGSQPIIGQVPVAAPAPTVAAPAPIVAAPAPLALPAY